MNPSFQQSQENTLSTSNSHQELGESLTQSAQPPEFRMAASGGTPAANNGAVAQRQTLIASGGEERDWYAEGSDWIRDQVNNDSMTGSNLMQLLGQLRNDSRATYHLRVTYYNRYRRNLLADIRLSLTRNGQQRWYEQVALAFNMSDAEYQRVLYLSLIHI